MMASNIAHLSRTALFYDYKRIFCILNYLFSCSSCSTIYWYSFSVIYISFFNSLSSSSSSYIFLRSLSCWDFLLWSIKAFSKSSLLPLSSILDCRFMLYAIMMIESFWLISQSPRSTLSTSWSALAWCGSLQGGRLLHSVAMPETFVVARG